MKAVIHSSSAWENRPIIIERSEASRNYSWRQVSAWGRWNCGSKWASNASWQHREVVRTEAPSHQATKQGPPWSSCSQSVFSGLVAASLGMQTSGPPQTYWIRTLGVGPSVCPSTGLWWFWWGPKFESHCAEVYTEWEAQPCSCCRWLQSSCPLTATASFYTLCHSSVHGHKFFMPTSP